MSVLGKIKTGTGLVCGNPGLASWYVRNKLRLATVGFERNHMNGASRFARGITFRLTAACNLQCKMCRFTVSGDIHSDLKKSLPIEEWKAIVDDVARFSPYVTLTGGEPLMYPQAGELITHISRHNMRCTLTTNGTLLTKRLPDFADAPPDLVVISLDGPADLHNEIRGQDRVFERAVEGIRAVQEIKRQTGSKKPALAINCSITSYSYKRVAEMVDVAAELGVDALNFQYQWSMTQKMVDDHNSLHGACHSMSAEALGVSDPDPVDTDEMLGVIRQLRELAKRSTQPLVTFHPELSDDEVRVWYSDPHAWVQRKPATCAWINTEILPTGSVEPCFCLSMGNVTETPLSEMWNSLRYREFRQRLAQAGDLPMCVRCCAFFRRD